jgi:hypothetical protein
MPTATKYKVASTKRLEEINSVSVLNGLNRGLDPEVFTKSIIDVDGKHLLVNTYLLDDCATFRTEWLVKLTNLDDPATVFIDTDQRLIESLPEVLQED